MNSQVRVPNVPFRLGKPLSHSHLVFPYLNAALGSWDQKSRAVLSGVVPLGRRWLLGTHNVTTVGRDGLYVSGRPASETWCEKRV